MAGKQSVSLCAVAARRVALCAAFIQCLASTQATDALPAPASSSPPAQAQPPTYLPQGHQMERYKAFARQTELPVMTVSSNTVLKVGAAATTDVTRLARLTTREKAALAGQLGVPAGVIDKVVQRAAKGSPPTADQLAQELRTAAIDYRFLQVEWDRYHPPAEGGKTKAAAVEALQAGDLTTAWKLYDELRKPQAPGTPAPAPPTNLRVVAQP
jgi:hypothetical protein